jgi:hypothetical protein
VHRSYDNDTLAAQFDTVEKLLADEKVFKFVRWVRTQKLRSKRDAINPSIHYRR